MSNKTSVYKNDENYIIGAKIIGALSKKYIKVLHEGQVMQLKWDETADRYQADFFGDLYYSNFEVKENLVDAIHVGDFGTAEQSIELTTAKRRKSGRPAASVFYTKR